MSDFFHEFGAEVLQSLKTPQACTRVILPSRRAIAMVKQAMGQKLKSPVFLPVFQTMGDFLSDFSGLKISDTNTLSLSLYHTYSRQIEDQRPLEDYLSWAPTLLNDFNDIDLSLAPVPQIFDYLTKARAIELWNLNRDPLTPFQQQYLHFWEKMPAIYEAFTQYCLNLGIAYQGMAARKLAEKDLENIPEKEIIYFAGLNLLSVAEEKIIKHLLSHQKGKIFWQADDYYLKDKIHEAGRFIRTYHEKWQETGESYLWSGKLLAEGKKNMVQIGCSGSIEQAQVGSDLVFEFATQNHHKIGVILGDEKLLGPLLSELPKGIEINITKSLNVNQTPFWRWLQMIVKNYARSEDHGEVQLSAQTLFQFFQHPVGKSILPWRRLEDWKYQIIQKGKNRWTREELYASLKTFNYPAEYLERVPSLFFSQKIWLKAFQEIFGHLEWLVQKISEQQTGGENFLYLQGLASLSAFRQTGNLVLQSELEKEINWTIFSSMLESIGSKIGLSSVGQKESGIQVMGLLESRGMDFDTLIVLGANDGNLPQSSEPNSFIPLDIRREFHLPGKTEREALYAYHFYRLLQSPENIFLLYGTQTDEFGSGEKSRYLQQLDFEAQKKNKNIQLSHQIINNALPAEVRQMPWSIKNNEEIIASLKGLLKKGLAPTSLSILKNCSLQFYFRYLARVNEPEEMEEILQMNTIGTAIHSALENYYKPFLNTRKFSFPDIKSVSELLKNGFNEKFSNPELKYGYNHLLFRMALKLTEMRIRNDKKWFEQDPEMIITGLEQRLTRNIEVKGIEVLIKGIADRIQENNKEIQILDYKSGSVSDSDLNIPEVVSMNEISDKALQLLTYTWLAGDLTKDKKIRAGILPLKKISKEAMWLEDSKKLDSWLNEFEKELSAMLEPLLNLDFHYQKTENTDTCLYCSFKEVCNR